MLKVLVWVFSNDARFFQGTMTILDRQHGGIELVGVTAGIPVQLQVNGKNVDFIALDKVGAQDFDVLLVVGAKQIGMSNVTKVARQLKLPDEKLLGDWIACVPGFALKKYRQLQRAQLSIVAQHCFGGFISHTLGLPFRTPIINMWFKGQEYIHFLRAPRLCMAEKLTLKKMVWNDGFKYYHPIATLGNVDIVLNHYPDFDAAVEIWNRRKARINWYNLFVTAYTDSEELLREFDALPYGKKVCFVPFKSDLDSAWYINPDITKHEHLWQKVNDFAQGGTFYYDVFDMLLYGKKTSLIEM